MTFRARPVVQRNQKPSWESRDRRNFFLNLGFGLAVVAALVILAIAVGWSYYNDHLVSVGKVDGQTITKDELRERYQIEGWRLSEAANRIRTITAAGHLSQSEADLQLQYIENQQQASTLAGVALERIIDNRIQAKLATEEGVSVSDADIDARLAEEATIKESRHAWQIEVKPESTAGQAPTSEQIAAARSKADAALADLKAGKTWDDIAKTVSTDSATAAQAGDLGWIGKEDTQTDEALLNAMFGLEKGATTDVIEGDDGIFRIGRVTDIAPASVDDAYTEKIVNDGIDLGKYRAVVRGDVIRKKLEDKLVADASKPGPQRETREIHISQATVDLPDDAVKVRHILFSPNDDPQAATSLAEDDPAWGQAELDAQGAYVKLQGDISQFDSLARTKSDESSALGPQGTGGVLQDYVVPGDTTYTPKFSEPILAAKPTDGQLLPPIRTEFGWHVVQVLHHAPDLAKVKERIDGGADFATLARELSEGAEAPQGGDLGWVAKGQYDKALIDAIFATPVGKTSAVVNVEGDGQYLFQVTKEEQRTAEGRQLDAIRSRLFSDWYQPKKDAVSIERDETLSSTSG
jgi:parvulin-like peptidyl-prolyl isomerase